MRVDQEEIVYPHEIIPSPDANCDPNEARIIATSANGYLYIDGESVSYSIGKDQFITSTRQAGTVRLHYNERGNVASIDFGVPTSRRKGRLLLSYDPTVLGVPEHRQQEIVAGLRFANIRAIRIKGLGDEHGIEQLPNIQQPAIEHNLS